MSPSNEDALFAGALAKPADESAPLDSGSTHDDLILWLACKEARAMIDGQP